VQKSRELLKLYFFIIMYLVELVVAWLIVTLCNILHISVVTL